MNLASLHIHIPDRRQATAHGKYLFQLIKKHCSFQLCVCLCKYDFVWGRRRRRQQLLHRIRYVRRFDKSTSAANFRKSKPVNGYDFSDSSESRCFCSMPRTGLLCSLDFISKSYMCIHGTSNVSFVCMYVTANAQLRNNSIECVHCSHMFFWFNFATSGSVLRCHSIQSMWYNSAPSLSIIFILSSFTGTLLALYDCYLNTHYCCKVHNNLSITIFCVDNNTIFIEQPTVSAVRGQLYYIAAAATSQTHNTIIITIAQVYNVHNCTLKYASSYFTSVFWFKLFVFIKIEQCTAFGTLHTDCKWVDRNGSFVQCMSKSLPCGYWGCVYTLHSRTHHVKFCRRRDAIHEQNDETFILYLFW